LETEKSKLFIENNLFKDPAIPKQWLEEEKGEGVEDWKIERERMERETRL
jgi:hypothetical protein